jgi:hypothetical protein
MSDNKYFDLIFEGQFIFVPNVEDLSVTVYRPGNSVPTVIKSGSLHSWDLEEASMNQSNTREQRSTTSFAEVRVPRKVARKGNQQDVGDYVKKTTYNQLFSYHVGFKRNKPFKGFIQPFG